MDITNYGMLWQGTDGMAAVNHFQTKYNALPNFVRSAIPVELPDSVELIIDKRCNGCIIVGVDSIEVAREIYPPGLIE